MSKKLEIILANMYIARQIHKAAKEKRRQATIEHGRCDGYSNHPEGNPCYVQYPNDPCEICKIKWPIQKEYEPAAKAAAMALRAAMVEGRRCTPSAWAISFKRIER